MRLESQLSRMNCQTFSTGLSSGHFGGSRMMVGWTESRNIRIEHRYSGGGLGRMRAYAQELVRSAPDLIVGSGTPITAALKQATGTIPIVFNVVTIRSDKVWWPACRS